MSSARAAEWANSPSATSWKTVLKLKSAMPLRW